MSDSEKPIDLTPDQALSMLPDSDTIHTFRSNTFALFGADWKRSKIEEAIRENACEIGGAACCGMNHGLVVHIGDSPLFVECKPGFDYAVFAEEVRGDQ